jgi:hypothetical protein
MNKENGQASENLTLKDWIRIIIMALICIGLGAALVKSGRESVPKIATYKLHFYIKKCDCSSDKVVNGVVFKGDTIITYNQTNSADGGIFKFYKMEGIDSIYYQLIN